jgi:osmotically-inducible protein OsmY
MASLRDHRTLVVAIAFVAFPAAFIASSACREQASAEKAVVEPEPAVSTPAPVAAPVKVESDADQQIRRELTTAIAQEPSLRDRVINFTIDGGDVSVTGTVRTEIERQKVNDLAMQINGVKSVANALRVSPS